MTPKAYCAPCATTHSIHPKGDELLRHRVAMWTAPLDATEAWRKSVATPTAVDREAMARRLFAELGET